MGQGCCGGKETLPGRVETLVNASKMLADGHVGMAALYMTVAADVDSDEDKAAMKAAADNHLRLAKETEVVTLPEDAKLPPELAKTVSTPEGAKVME